jgi:predicted HTH transcriptional regulator
VEESLIQRRRDGGFDITNLGALLFGRDLGAMRGLERKALRIVSYEEDTRTGALREKVIQTGYALGFERALEAIHDLLMTRQHVGAALREEQSPYPALALRELVANALIHQDFNVSGAGPLVEIFASRIELSNPGQPLLDPLRFLDMPPRSRNEQLAALMRRLRICEELGTGIDKVIRATEQARLPPPDFQRVGDNTRAILYAWRPLQALSKQEKLRACYQHACLQWVEASTPLTNASLRERLSIEASSYQLSSKIIADALDAQMIKPLDPDNRSRRTASYIPFWA